MLAEQTTVAPLVKYDVTEAAIAVTKARCADLSADTPKGYEEVRLALAEIRGTRVAIEKRRVELKADALAFGRLVDSEAKRYTALLLEIEEPLSQKKHDVDYEKARVKAAAEEARQAEIAAKIRAEREAEEAKLRAAREADEARLATERKALEAERAALAEARAVLEAARRAEEERQRAEGEALRVELKRKREADEAAARAERDAIEQERRKVAAEREKAERIEFERQAKIKAEAEAVAKAERDRLAAAEQAARIAALAPDIEKVRAFASSIRALSVPKCRTMGAKAAISDAVNALTRVTSSLDTFGAA